MLCIAATAIFFRIKRKSQENSADNNQNQRTRINRVRFEAKVWDPTSARKHGFITPFYFPCADLDENRSVWSFPIQFVVGEAGLEPASLGAREPKSRVYTNFTTRPVKVALM